MAAVRFVNFDKGRSNAGRPFSFALRPVGAASPSPPSLIGGLSLAASGCGATLGVASAALLLCYGHPVADKPSQLDKFKQVAHDLETDDDPERFDERMKKLVKQKPAEKPE